MHVIIRKNGLHFMLRRIIQFLSLSCSKSVAKIENFRLLAASNLVWRFINVLITLYKTAFIPIPIPTLLLLSVVNNTKDFPMHITLLIMS